MTLDKNKNQNDLFVTTINEKGKVVSEQKVEPGLAGFCSTVQRDEGAGSERKIRVSVMNEAGKVLAVQNHSPSSEQSATDAKGRRIIRQTTEGESVTKLYPVLLGHQYVV